MSAVRPHVVFLSADSPYESFGGASIRNDCLLRLISEVADVDLVFFNRGPGPAAALTPEIPRDLRLVPVTRGRTPAWKKLSYPFRSYVVNGFSPEMASMLKAQYGGESGRQEILWISSLGMAQYLPYARQLGYRVILDQLNIESNLLLYSSLSSWRTWHKLPYALDCRMLESRFCRSADRTLVTSVRDATLLKGITGRVNARVLPNMIDCGPFAAPREEGANTFLFTGTLDYHPNLEGLDWFLERVLPTLREKSPRGAPQIRVAGARPSAKLRRKLSDNQVELSESPDSIAPLLREAVAVFVPLFLGGGTRLKILEAMAAGVPVVSTTKGAEGLELGNRDEILIENEPIQFADALLRLAGDPTLSSSLSRAGRRTAEGRFHYENFRRDIGEILDV